MSARITPNSFLFLKNVENESLVEFILDKPQQYASEIYRDSGNFSSQIINYISCYID